MKKILICLAFATLAVGSDGYRLLRRISIPDEGGWDYLTVDSDARRVYVSHGDQVAVLDADAGTVLGTIPAKGSHGIAVAKEFGRGFITNGTANTVTVFDLKTLKAIAEIPTGKKPDAIFYDDTTKRIFANNNGATTSTVINAADNKTQSTVELGGAPESSASDGKGSVFTNLEDTHELVKIDAVTMKVVARWKLSPCEEPSALAIDRSTRRLFTGCRNQVMAMVDADSGNVILTRPIGDHVDAAAFDPETKTVFMSNGDGTVNVFVEESASGVRAMPPVKTQEGAKTMALDLKTHRLFLSVADYAPADGKGRKVKPGTFGLLVFGQ